MSPIDFGICSYGNFKGLLDVLASTAPLAGRKLVVNAPFQGYPHEDLPSGIYETQYLARHPNIILCQSTEPLNQIEARNLYLELSTADFLCVIDDDELMIRHNIPVLEEEQDKIKNEFGDRPALLSCLYVQHNGIPNLLPRIMYLPKRFRYIDAHFHFKIDGEYYGAHTSRSMKGITLRHVPAEEAGRTSEFEKGMERYEMWQRWSERQTWD